jgi:translocator protein
MDAGPMSDRSIRALGTEVRLIHLALFLGVSYATLVVGSVFTRIDEWYETLAKPAWTPPGWLIGAVWTFLYTLIGIAGALAWSGTSARIPNSWFATLYATNLVLNAGWSFMFFTAREIAWAVVEISVLAVSTILLAVAAGLRQKWAGWMLVPYAAWVMFAGFLNFTIWRLNA